MSLRASQSSRDGNADRRWPRRSHNSRRQARFSIRRPIACRRCRSKSLMVDANPALLFIYPSRGCVPSQQSILPPLRNVIGDWRLGTIFGKIIERCWCFGDAKCCCATVSGRLSFRARRIARRIQLHQRHCLANWTRVRVVGSPEVSHRSGRQAAPDFPRRRYPLLVV